MSFASRVEISIGKTMEFVIGVWVRIAGRRVLKAEAQWLNCPMGTKDRIGAEFYKFLAEKENLEIKQTDDSGLLESFEQLRSPVFDPSQIHPLVRHFYEHTSCYRLEAWSESPAFTRIFLWALTRFISKRMDQLNFPVSSLELSEGMTSEILPMFNLQTRKRVHTGWLRRIASTKRVIYTGLYTVEPPAEFNQPCVKVSFPIPRGSATVFLRPEAVPDGSFKLISSGSQFGDPGFYRMIEAGADSWHVLRIRTLKEYFHVYVDDSGVLRTVHLVKFMGFTALRLVYKMERHSE